jgi:RNA polymerase sigma factor FliA
MPGERVSAARKQKVTKMVRDRIVIEHLPLVKAIAVRVHENLPVHVDVDDLFHAGVLGLFDAAGKYNPDKKVAFAAYAKHRIKGAILDSLRQLDWASRDQRKRQKQIESATRILTAKLGRVPNDSEVAESMGFDPIRWRRVSMEMRMVGLLSASSRPVEQSGSIQPDFPARPDSQPDMMCEREQLRATLSRAMHTLPERYQKVVFLYYSNEMTMKEIGDVLGVNESRVSQIHKIALEKMAGALKSVGISSARAF